MRSTLPALLLLVCGAAGAAASQLIEPDQLNYADLSIEDLAQIPITSVSRKPEALAQAAASVYVITAEDIRRSGADSLPEILRLAPNLEVARTNSYTYAVSARGMNGSQNSTPNKLLVMIDGRSAYSPFFAGVLWDVQDTMLEDIERIEVISGPGGVLWGVNAVNAVINIITRRQVQGALAAVNAGNQGGSAAVRYGGDHGAGNWRAYARTVRQRHTETAAGSPVDDERRLTLAGFQGDMALGDDHFTVSGNLYDGHEGQPKPGSISVSGTNLVLGDIDTSGANLTGTWTRNLAGGAALSLQAYLDHSERTVPPTFSQRLDVFDLQLLHTLGAYGAHQPTWGASYRVDRDRATNSVTVAFLPPHVTQSWTSVFAQDEWTLQPGLRLTVGARGERNPYTGTEFLPSARMAWTAADNTLLWGGVSRTVRAPTRLDVDTFIPGKPPFLLDGGSQVRAEVARVYEVGYRGQPRPGVSASVTLFQHRYDDLRTQEIAPSRTFVVFASGMEGRATGIEAWGSVQVTPSWRLSGGATGLNERFWSKPGSNDTMSPATSGRDPHHQFQLRSSHTLDHGVEFDLAARRVGHLRSPAVPAYTAIDARLGWRISPQWELALIGQNLNGAHAEYGALATRAEIPRAIGMRLTYRN